MSKPQLVTIRLTSGTYSRKENGALKVYKKGDTLTCSVAVVARLSKRAEIVSNGNKSAGSK